MSVRMWRFLPLIFSPGVIATNAAALGGLHTLAVDHAGTRTGFAAFCLAERHQQIVVDRLPHAGVASGVEIALHRRRRWETRRQHSPRQPAAQEIQNGIDDRRIGHSRGRPTAEAAGRNGSSTAHSASVKSLGKPGPLRACCARVVAVHIVDLSGSSQKPRTQHRASAHSVTDCSHPT